MSTDIAIPIDGRISLDAEPHAYRVQKPAPALANGSQVPATLRKAAREAQAKRHRALLAEGHIVKVGQLGTTVFRGSGSDNFTPFKVWDGFHEATPKPTKRKLIPGEGFAD
jgi:hypothetical protein